MRALVRRPTQAAATYYLRSEAARQARIRQSEKNKQWSRAPVGPQLPEPGLVVLGDAGAGDADAHDLQVPLAGVRKHQAGAGARAGVRRETQRLNCAAIVQRARHLLQPTQTNQVKMMLLVGSEPSSMLCCRHTACTSSAPACASDVTIPVSLRRVGIDAANMMGMLMGWALLQLLSGQGAGTQHAVLKR